MFKLFITLLNFIWLNGCNQGITILLTADEHCIGRLVDDVRFQIDSNSVSANHCRIYRMTVTTENMENTSSIFLKDTRFGFFLAWVPCPSSYRRGRKEVFFFFFCPSSYSDFCKVLFSTNGTYLNWEKLKKNGPAVKVCHGDIISFAAPPQHGNMKYFQWLKVSIFLLFVFHFFSLLL